MDFLKKAANDLSNKQNSGVGAVTGDNTNNPAAGTTTNTTGTGVTGTGTAGQPGQQQDYGDKGMLSFHLRFSQEVDG